MGERKNVKVGDLVIVVDASMPRATWPLARVKEAVESGNGVVRTVKLHSTVGVMTRPVVKVCVLEEAGEHVSRFNSSLFLLSEFFLSEAAIELQRPNHACRELGVAS